MLNVNSLQTEFGKVSIGRAALPRVKSDCGCYKSILVLWHDYHAIKGVEADVSRRDAGASRLGYHASAWEPEKLYKSKN
ncbi:hypothetical protein THIOM_005759 [Candidatus Thiomargarita nelsonii]|uniref:Uncharacterized protein n=1 Tax=Candidatus Thiomargarita nelsonii TaxID=1003181 RepID=A0A176RSB1_9GAMM|nr:hypothetical protein THIOM_005759 [Candidatus Thiomargarita nelsonii]